MLYYLELGFRRRRSTFEDDLDLVSILKSLNLIEDKFNRHSNDIDDNNLLSPDNLCKIKRKICKISENARSSIVSRKDGTQIRELMKLKRFFVDLR